MSHHGYRSLVQAALLHAIGAGSVDVVPFVRPLVREPAFACPVPVKIPCLLLSSPCRLAARRSPLASRILSLAFLSARLHNVAAAAALLASSNRVVLICNAYNVFGSPESRLSPPVSRPRKPKRSALLAEIVA